MENEKDKNIIYRIETFLSYFFLFSLQLNNTNTLLSVIHLNHFSLFVYSPIEQAKKIDAIDYWGKEKDPVELKLQVQVQI